MCDLSTNITRVQLFSTLIVDKMRQMRNSSKPGGRSLQLTIQHYTMKQLEIEEVALSRTSEPYSADDAENMKFSLGVGE